MILGYFLPDQEFSWEELDRISHKLPGLSTWPQSMLIYLIQHNFDAFMIESFDIQSFLRDGGDYLISDFGEEAGNWMIQNSDIRAEQETFRQALAAGVRLERREPTQAEIKSYLDDGYLVICTVNSRALNDQDGYVGHAVVIYDMDDNMITLHDPGLPPIEARQVTREAFETAWASPAKKAKSMVGIKYLGTMS